MKKLIIALSILPMLFASCSSNESMDIPEAQTAQLASYTLQKDVNGRYSIDYTTTSNSEVVKNIASNTNEIHLSSDGLSARQNNSQELNLENNTLKVGFFENAKTKTSFVVEDSNIVLAKGEKNNEYLKEYSMSSNNDETFELNFKVKEGIAVEFIYNDADDVYEINLMKGTSNTTTFSKTFTKDANDLKIDFINHIAPKNTQAALRSRSIDAPSIRKKRPRMVIVTS